MAISLDSAQGADKASGLTNWSYTHTTVGAIQAVLVLVGHQFNGDNISACSFGGVSLGTRLWRIAPTPGGDSSPQYAFFKNGGFGGLTPGAQTVAITETDNTAGLAGSFALAAATDCEIVATVSTDLGTVTDPSVTVAAPAGRNCFIAAFLASGRNIIEATSAAGQTRVKDRDYGSQSAYVDRKTNIHTGGNTNMAWTVTSATATVGAVAVAEVVTVPRSPGTNFQNPGVFARAEKLWERRHSRIFVPGLWAPPRLGFEG